MEGLLLTLLNAMAIWTACGLNVDRFYAIASPLHYGAIVNPRRVLIGLAVGWVLVLILAIPPLVTTLAPFIFIPELAACFPRFVNQHSIYFSAVYTLITFIVPTIIILGCNIRVLQIAKRHRHRIASAIYEVTLSAQVTITHQRNPFFVPSITAPSAGGPRFRSRSPVASTTYLVGSLVLLYCPLYVAILFQSISVFFARNEMLEKCGKYLLIIASGLLVTAPSVNGALYGLKSKVLRKSFQNYWRKQMSKNEVNHEIQARTPSTCGSRRPSLTPFGLLGRPCLQRQMSEMFFDSVNNNLPGGDKPIKRTSSELTWPASNLLENEKGRRPGDSATLPHTSSCSTLVVPQEDNGVVTATEQELYLTIKNSFRSPSPRNFTLNISSHNSGQGANGNAHKYRYTNLLANTNRSINGGARFLNKVLRFDSSHHTQQPSKLKVANGERRNSVQPQILITSACSMDQGSADEDDDEQQQLNQLPPTDYNGIGNSNERLELCSFSNKSTETDELTVDQSDQLLKETFLEPLSNSSYQQQETSDENATTITTIAQSVSKPPKQKRVQSLDATYQEGSPTSSLSENEEQLLLLSWPIVSRKVHVVQGNKKRKYIVESSFHKTNALDDEEIDIDFQQCGSDSPDICKSSRRRDVYSSEESIIMSMPSSSVSLFSDRVEAPEIII